jgi:hypothetical protein
MGASQSQAVAEQAISLGGTAATVGATIAGAASAIPIIGPIIGIAEMLASLIGGGCGQACINSSKAEQIYEYACECLDRVAAAGQLGQSDLLAGLNTFLSAGQAHMEQLEATDSSAKKGYTNLTTSIGKDISAASSIPATAPNALNLNTVASLFPSTSGWYPDSASNGAQIAMAYLQSLPAASLSQGVSVNSAAGTISVLGSTFSFTEVLLLAGAAWLAYSFLG